MLARVSVTNTSYAEAGSLSEQRIIILCRFNAAPSLPPYHRSTIPPSSVESYYSGHMRGPRDSDLAGLLVLVPILAEGRRPSSSSTTYDSSSNRIAQAYSNSTNTIAPAQALNHDFSYAAPISTKRLSWRAGLGPVSQHLADLNIYRLVPDSAVPIEDEEQHLQAVENDFLVYLDDSDMSGCRVVPLPARMTTTAELYPRIYELEAQVADLIAQRNDLAQQLSESVSDRSHQDVKYENLWQQYMDKGF
ncbi:hypothetical protein QFC20_004772 [Naganishia adeliensis]|uniref:Uncharacterized protein n=1 Tax=Naganishia adeliensis TaxID=92952 RepID=A0ACC2VYC6_9TREE|nr:hypothetical protein QFC20_004772 [Naganishia adeliensis]